MKSDQEFKEFLENQKFLVFALGGEQQYEEFSRRQNPKTWNIIDQIRRVDSNKNEK